MDCLALMLVSQTLLNYILAFPPESSLREADLRYHFKRLAFCPCPFPEPKHGILSGASLTQRPPLKWRIMERARP